MVEARKIFVQKHCLPNAPAVLVGLNRQFAAKEENVTYDTFWSGYSPDRG
ncbi:hypothetical protein JGS22_015510 [Streptomyces sp. P38-E01]|uniref:Uncharacterized protein n=1 Tax=Streptomyces tardus TaxID=2780544 RepID=A0A949JHI5_9ACTN|nr:hypothetical protein [Streptomyces tardus]MBU7598978.1 hypothetical protein [Streptomyces tardus]